MALEFKQKHKLTRIPNKPIPNVDQFIRFVTSISSTTRTEAEATNAAIKSADFVIDDNAEAAVKAINHADAFFIKIKEYIDAGNPYFDLKLNEFKNKIEIARQYATNTAIRSDDAKTSFSALRRAAVTAKTQLTTSSFLVYLVE